MNTQYFSGRQIRVEYAVKKDSKANEKHGSFAERLLAENKPYTAGKINIIPTSALVTEKPNANKGLIKPGEVPLAMGGISLKAPVGVKGMPKMAEIKLPPMPALPK